MYFTRCLHLTLAGARCTYPALRNKEFCYDHHYRRVRRRHRLTPVLADTQDIVGPLVTFVDIEDYASILENINNIAIAFSEHAIDHRRVSCLTYLMNTAIKTVDRMRAIEKLRNEDMPTDVTHDDLNQPMACPPEPAAADEAPGLSKSPEPAKEAPPVVTCHPDAELREAEVFLTDPTTANEAPPVVACHPESAKAGEGSAVVLTDSTPEEAPPVVACHPESAKAGEGSAVVPGNPTPEEAPDHSAKRTEEERLALQSQNYDQMHRRLNPHIYPTLNAAAEPEPDAPRYPRNASLSNNLPPTSPATPEESNTCHAIHAATPADSTLATLQGGTPNEAHRASRGFARAWRNLE